MVSVSDDKRWRRAPVSTLRKGGDLMQRPRYKESRSLVRSEHVEESPAHPAGQGFADLNNLIRPCMVHDTDFH